MVSDIIAVQIPSLAIKNTKNDLIEIQVIVQQIVEETTIFPMHFKNDFKNKTEWNAVCSF